jgi:hypothetical protein
MDRSISADELEQLRSGVQQRCAGMERIVHRRDLREIVACLVVVAAFVAMWPLYRSSPVALVGVALIILSAVIITRVLLSAGKPDPIPFDATVVECSRNRLAWIERQIRLLRSVLWWYVVPLFSGVLLLGWGIYGGSLIPFGMHAVIIVVVGTGIVLLNRWAVRVSLQPVRDDLVHLIEALESADPDRERPTRPASFRTPPGT